MIKGIIFDCDGLMFDSEHVSMKVWKQFGEKYGYDFDEEFFNGITGVGVKEAKAQFDRYENIEEMLPIFYPERQKAIFYHAQHEGITKKGLEELLTYLSDKDYKVAIGSSSSRQYVDTLLATLSKPYHFDYIVTGDMIENRKPFPDIYLKCSEELKLDPHECLVLEDAKMGIIAAKRANMKAGFIYDTVKKDDSFSSLIDYEFESLLDVIDFLENKK